MGDATLGDVIAAMQKRIQELGFVSEGVSYTVQVKHHCSKIEDGDVVKSQGQLLCFNLSGCAIKTRHVASMPIPAHMVDEYVAGAIKDLGIEPKDPK